MAKEKKGGGLGGCLMQLLLGVLAAIAAVMAVLFFLSSAPIDDEGRTTADDAAANAVLPDPAVTPQAPPPAEDKSPRIPTPADAGMDPASDDQIADDAAAAGMTSRTPSKGDE